MASRVDTATSRNYLLLALSLLGCLAFLHTWYAQMGILWDLAIYSRGTHEFLAGIDPYRGNAELIFVCHPWLLRAFVAINAVLPLANFFVGLYALIAVWFAVEVRRVMTAAARPAATDGPDYRVALGAALAFGGAGVISAISGNMTPYMHLAVLAAIFGGCTRPDKRRAYLGILVAVLTVCALIKPYFLVYAAAFFFLTTPLRSFGLGAVVTAIVAGAWLASSHVMPLEYATFVEALRQQTLGKNDLGFSFYGIIRPLFASETIKLGIHAIISLALLYWAAFRAPRTLQFTHDQLGRFLFVCPMLIVMNPRMKEYDFFVAALCLWIFLHRYSSRRNLRAMLWGMGLSLMPAINAGLDLLGQAPIKMFAKEHIWQMAGLALVYLLFYRRAQSPGTSRPDYAP